MRSFRLFILLLAMSVIQTSQAAEKGTMGSSFFTVVFPYETFKGVPGGGIKTPQSVNLTSTQKASQVLDQAITQGMETLLVKITGQKRFLGSAVAQGYLKNAKAWLVTYDIKPRMEDGVQVGQNIVLQYSAPRLTAAFKQHRVDIWPLAQRPKLLVMGSFLYKGELLKMTEDMMRYRIDIEFRHYPQQMALPITLPESAQNWILPQVPNPSNALIRTVLQKANQDYLLSFKLIKREASTYALVWTVFAPSGVVVTKGQITGGDRPSLMQAMFDQVMQRYALLAKQTNSDVQKITLNVYDLVNADQMQEIEMRLKANQAMFNSIKLRSIQAGLVQYEIDYQGRYQNVVTWLRAWQIIDFIGESNNLHQVDVKLNPNFYDQLGLEKTASEKNLQGVQ
ncbi:MAG: DUF2066 domain-containing protein [Thiomicrorhabdus sp.]|jgi:hypothetical protein|nr:DUF2066 domain-containing protein [Thiomicrorhabdus sp.]